MEEELKKLRTRLMVMSVVLSVSLFAAVLIALYVVESTALAAGLGLGILLLEWKILGGIAARIRELEGEA